MPNGKIFVVVSGFQKGDKATEIYEINKRSWRLELRIKLASHFFYQGAVTSTVNSKMMISGSKYGKIKGVAMVDTKEKKINEIRDVTDLPDLNFGRYHHAMTVLEQRYLYVFGGKFVQNFNYHYNLFERLDLKYPQRGWDLIHFQWENPDVDPL